MNIDVYNTVIKKKNKGKIIWIVKKGKDKKVEYYIKWGIGNIREVRMKGILYKVVLYTPSNIPDGPETK